MTAWLSSGDTALRRHSRTLAQAKVWGISTVVRVESADGERWFKASARLPLFVDEAAVTEWLVRRFPGYVPAPVARDHARGWLLFEPFDVLGRHHRSTSAASCCAGSPGCSSGRWN